MTPAAFEVTGPWELFDDQPQEYRDRVLPPEVTARAIGHSIGMRSFGAFAHVKTIIERGLEAVPSAA